MTSLRILISILNWNKAAVTLQCLDALQQSDWGGANVEILVIDNGSSDADYAQLANAAPRANTSIVHLEKNLGFTGGHNISLARAVAENYDFIWLLNNDAIVTPSTLASLLRAICVDPRCGAVSPVIYSAEGVAHNNAWGVTHDWRHRKNMWIGSEAESRRLHTEQPENICMTGTAVLFRVQTIREVGKLDERLFAYYDDNDIGTRLARGGWISKVVFDSRILHADRPNTVQPPYFFYLMARNDMLFWHTHTPSHLRHLLWLKIVDGALFDVNRLRAKGLDKQADAALLGVSDFISGRFGAPELSRRAPLPLRLACRLRRAAHQKHQSSQATAASSA